MQFSFDFSGTYFPIGSRMAICDKPHWSLIGLLFGGHCTISVPFYVEFFCIFVCCLLFVISYPLSVVSCQLSVISL